MYGRYKLCQYAACRIIFYLQSFPVLIFCCVLYLDSGFLDTDLSHSVIHFANVKHCIASEIDDDIIYVNNLKELRSELINAIYDHRRSITVSYPGIYEEFYRFRFNDFFTDVSFGNGYYMGIISGYSISYNDSVRESVTFQFNYLTTLKQERYISRKVRKFAKRYKGKSRYERVKAAHDYLVKYMTYDTDYYSPYYAFRKGRGVCMSYALAYQRILDEMKIPCLYVRGNDHAWNMVKLKGRWYSVDVTWDDSEGTYRYFLKGTEDFPGHDLTGIRGIKKLKLARCSYIVGQ